MNKLGSGPTRTLFNYVLRNRQHSVFSIHIIDSWIVCYTSRERGFSPGW
jgi:hypothetical protein